MCCADKFTVINFYNKYIKYKCIYMYIIFSYDNYYVSYKYTPKWQTETFLNKFLYLN